MSRIRLSLITGALQVCLQGNSIAVKQCGFFLVQFTSPFGANLLFPVLSGSTYTLKNLGIHSYLHEHWRLLCGRICWTSVDFYVNFYHFNCS